MNVRKQLDKRAGVVVPEYWGLLIILKPFNNNVDDDDERLLLDDWDGSETKAQFVAGPPPKLINDNDGIETDGIRLVGESGTALGTALCTALAIGVGVFDLLPA